MEKRKCLVAVRIRGLSDISQEIKDTLSMLRLTRNCHATLLDDRPGYTGMLRKSKDCITWGEVSQENILYLVQNHFQHQVSIHSLELMLRIYYIYHS